MYPNIRTSSDVSRWCRVLLIRAITSFSSPLCVAIRYPDYPERSLPLDPFSFKNNVVNMSMNTNRIRWRFVILKRSCMPCWHDVPTLSGQSKHTTIPIRWLTPNQPYVGHTLPKGPYGLVAPAVPDFTSWVAGIHVPWSFEHSLLHQQGVSTAIEQRYNGVIVVVIIVQEEQESSLSF